MPNASADELHRVLPELWRQYEYRHSLCWSAVYKVTTAVVILAVVPYAYDELGLRWAALIPPLIGLVLAGFAIPLMNNELKRFAETKLAFHTLHDELLKTLITDEAVRCVVVRDLPASETYSTPFDREVRLYTWTLLGLSVVNAVVVGVWWIPR